MAYIGKSPTGTGVRSRFYYTQTSGGGTSISGTDDNNKTLTFTDGEYIDVFLNGVLLVAGTDYNTNTANTISGLAALANGDVVEVVVYDIFTVADTVSASQGGTFQGNVVFNGTTTGLDLNGNELILDADADTSITADTDDQIDFKTGGSDRMTIDSSGNVGIGTISPQSDLSVKVSTSRQLDVIKDSGDDNLVLKSSAPDASYNLRAIELAGEKVAFSTGASSGTSYTERMRIDSSGKVTVNGATANGFMNVQNTGSGSAGYVHYMKASNSGYGDTVCQQNVAGNTRNGFIFLRGFTEGDGDNQYNIRGDGNAFIDGSWSGGGADYAEFFEWDDANPSDEDRRGFSVVMVGNKIRKATSTDAASDIIGVVSATPTIIGDNAWDHWAGKYDRDDFGSYVYENHTVTRWTVVDAEGQGTAHEYHTDRIPSDVTVPDDATVHSDDDTGTPYSRKVRNTAFNEAQAYVPREERQEWDTVGLMGKLRLRAGQPTGDRWIKMRDIATDDDGNVTVEEWLVR